MVKSLCICPWIVTSAPHRACVLTVKLETDSRDEMVLRIRKEQLEKAHEQVIASDK